MTTTLFFKASSTLFPIPEDIIIDPRFILDEYAEVYRVVLSSQDRESDYADLFKELDTRLAIECFIDKLHIMNNSHELIMRYIRVTRTLKPFGTFYDLESGLEDISYNERKQDASTDTT